MAADTTIEKHEGDVVQAEPTRGGRVYRPPVDIIEKSDELLLVADMPGAKADAIDVDFDKGVLSVYARVEPRRDDENIAYVAREYGIGDYARSFQVGEGIDSAKIAAEFSAGVLTLHLPKTSAVQPKKIAVQAT